MFVRDFSKRTISRAIKNTDCVQIFGFITSQIKNDCLANIHGFSSGVIRCNNTETIIEKKLSVH
mgnify:CR=1 FL=1